MGVVMSTTFIGVAAGVVSSDLAVAGAGLYQAVGIAGALGTCLTMSILQASLKPMLAHALRGFDGKDEVSLAGYGDSALTLGYRSSAARSKTWRMFDH